MFEVIVDVHSVLPDGYLNGLFLCLQSLHLLFLGKELVSKVVDAFLREKLDLR